MKNRIRIGVLGFFLGLITIFGALYIDQIRGQATSLGLYQIDLAFIGYMLVGIGFCAPILLAILLTEIPRGKVFLRTVYYLPAVTTGLVERSQPVRSFSS